MKSRRLLLGRKVMTNLDSILKNRDIVLLRNVHLVKAMVFPVVMYGWESWTIRIAEHRRINAFELWCWRRLLRVPWTARRSNQSILKKISPEYSLEGLMLKLKFQYFGYLMWRTDSLEKTLILGKIEGGRSRGRQRMSGWTGSLTQWTWVWINSGSWWWTGRPGVLHSMGSEKFGEDWVTKLNWFAIWGMQMLELLILSENVRRKLVFLHRIQTLHIFVIWIFTTLGKVWLKIIIATCLKEYCFLY